MNEKDLTIVIAEDEPLLLQNLQKKIEDLNLGFKIIGTSQTGAQALDLVTDLKPDLLISDIKMPVMDGLTLLKNVRKINPSISFIITSGFADFEYAKTAIKLDVSDYLLKPLDSDELQSALLKIRTAHTEEQTSYEEFFNVEAIRNTPTQIAETLKDYLNIHYASEINFNKIASSMNYSSSYLTKIFYQQFETTPSKYIISLRIQKACHLLSNNPEFSVKQIGEFVGYHDQGYFSRIFKKQMNLSPLDYKDSNLR